MMPSGKYYVGDLCYVMHDEWDECCNLFFQGRKDHGCNEGEFNLKDGRRFANFNTAYGDGCYQSNVGTEHFVDSGSIGCIRIEDIREDISEERIKELGALITFDMPFNVGREEGEIQFGRMRIDTAAEWIE